MQIELYQGAVIEPCSFSAVIGPAGIAAGMINENGDLQRYLLLFVSGNYSRVLTQVDRNAGHFEVRRAFTAHQLLTILQEAAHTVVFIEHDPTLFDGAWDMIAPLAAALSEISRESAVILYSPGADRSFSLLTRKAGHVICYLPGPAGLREAGGSLGIRAARQETLDMTRRNTEKM
ncbi:MAG TPA: hypothetical protein VEI81_03120 [Methanoregula sp.]|nr:hypothetical protein [Methanoregula sp.]